MNFLPPFLKRWFSRPGESPRGADCPALVHEGPIDEQVLRVWLSCKLAGVLGVTPEEVDPACTFTDYGLDSMQAVRLSGDLEAWMGGELSPLLLYDYPSIDSLSRYLAEHAATREEIPAVLSDSSTV